MAARRLQQQSAFGGGDIAPVPLPSGGGDAALQNNNTKAAASGPPMDDGRRTAVRVWVFCLAMTMHSIFDGLSLGAECSLDGFISILVAVLSHKVFDG